MYKISEADARPDLNRRSVTNVRVSVIADDGTTARVQIQDCGIHLRQGEIYTVPSTALTYRH